MAITWSHHAGKRQSRPARVMVVSQTTVFENLLAPGGGGLDRFVDRTWTCAADRNPLPAALRGPTAAWAAPVG